MEWLFITVTNGTNTRACYGTGPAAIDVLDAILGKPLKWQLSNVALVIGFGSGHCRNMQS
jgi:hypothetical protein